MKFRIASLRSTIAVAVGAMAVLATAGSALAAPVKYNIDPNHTYPSFEADHFGGLSVWRGKFNSTSGTVVYDKEAQSGTVDVKVDAATINFGNEKLDKHVSSAEMLDAAKFPAALYKGKLGGFKNGAPTEIDGTFELHGVTKPLKLTINKFTCKTNPVTKKDVCGADASGSFNREDFGVSYGKAFGFDMTTKLQIQVEAIRAE